MSNKAILAALAEINPPQKRERSMADRAKLARADGSDKVIANGTRVRATRDFSYRTEAGTVCVSAGQTGQVLYPCASNGGGANARAAFGKAGGIVVVQWDEPARLQPHTTPAMMREAATKVAQGGEPECHGHPSGTDGPMGATAYCDGSCRSATRRA